ncbi:MAG: hypothetical protein ACI90Q_002075 [Nonlabens sp.]|jgi:uncharacterized protein (DUF2237 family)
MLNYIFILICSIPICTMAQTTKKSTALNVLGTALESCCNDPITGYWRDGFCRTANEDQGTHVVCAVMTQEFLEYTKSKGNDLTRAIPAYQFPGLKAGDKWCLCILRWLDAEKAGVAPPIALASTDDKALDYTTLELLKRYAIDE